MIDAPTSGEVISSNEPCDRLTHPTGLLWFWCVRDRNDGFMPMIDDPTSGEVSSSSEPYDRLTHPTS
jgi:hypothetical protein